MRDNSRKLIALSTPFLVGAILLAVIIIRFSFGLGVIMSGSMEPALKKNDLIVIRRTGNYRIGDIVVYEAAGQLIVHRIMNINGDRIVAKGDANNVQDAPISKSDIRGVVIGKIMNIPEYTGQGLLAKFVSAVSGSSTAEVAGWYVSALEETPDTIQVLAGVADYGDDGYEFSVESDSETTAEYRIGITLTGDDETIIPAGLTLGLFRYDEESGAWYLATESSTGELEYEDILPIGSNSEIFKLKVLADDMGIAGNYHAGINVDVAQVD